MKLFPKVSSGPAVGVCLFSFRKREKVSCQKRKLIFKEKKEKQLQAG
jgi:hypothetical protein